MHNQDVNFLNAIRMAMDAEQKATTFYNDAVPKTTNPLARKLFGQLANFEHYHYTKLADLEKSLCENNACIMYENRELDFPVPDEVEQIKQADTTSAMGIITMAMEIKSKAKEKYTALAEQTTDPDGQDMLKRLAAEEDANHKILDKVYWRLNNRGGDAWSRQSS
ncbi:MAG: ferritin family protein [Chloroflexi bacterium]|nr:ferritin family protein [Chloroflexota bacterium]